MIFLLVVIAVYTTVWFVSALKPISTGALVCFLIWLICPYAVMVAALIFLYREGVALTYAFGVAMVISIGGVLYLADVIFWHPDAQGAIAVLMTPLYQVVGILVLLLPIFGRVLRNVLAKKRQIQPQKIETPK
ncbi:MAG: hypothetical protein HOP02_07455 [Methylococcaceae bacterium]|nr:hypothetical protein [Methylococcaceae bacterium]